MPDTSTTVYLAYCPVEGGAAPLTTTLGRLAVFSTEEKLARYVMFRRVQAQPVAVQTSRLGSSPVEFDPS